MARPDRAVDATEFSKHASDLNDYLAGMRAGHDSISMSRVLELLNKADKKNQELTRKEFPTAERPIDKNDLIRIMAMRDVLDEEAGGSWFMNIFSKAIKEKNVEVVSRLLEVAKGTPFGLSTEENNRIGRCEPGDWRSTLNVFFEKKSNGIEKDLIDHLFETNIFLCNGKVVDEKVLEVLCKGLFQMKALPPSVKDFVTEALGNVGGNARQRLLLEEAQTAINLPAPEARAEVFARIALPPGSAPRVDSVEPRRGDGCCVIQ